RLHQEVTMYSSTQFLSDLHDPPTPPVVYDTPPVITRRPSLLARTIGALRVFAPRSAHVAVELQSVSVGVADMKLARTPRCVGHSGSIGQRPELVGQTVDVVHGEAQCRSIARDPDEVMPLQRQNRVVATDDHERRSGRVIAELLHESELCVEAGRGCHV